MAYHLKTISILMVLVVVLVCPSISSSGEDETTYHIGIENKMDDIVKILTGISKSMITEFPTICNQSIGNLENIVTDWNPEGIYSHGDEVTLTCKRGFLTPLLEKEQTISCALGNVWSTFEPCSIKSCIKPFGHLENAKSSWIAGSIYFPGDEITITCDKYHTTSLIAKEQKISCLPDNTWSNFEPCIIEECPSPFEKFEDMCLYLAKQELMIWPDAKYYCENLIPERGSSMVAFNSPAQQRSLLNYGTAQASTLAFWISANDQDNEGHYVWPDKEKLVLPTEYLKWVSGQPNNMQGGSSYANTDQDCLIITFRTSKTHGEIEDIWCTEKYYAMCYIPVQ